MTSTPLSKTAPESRVDRYEAYEPETGLVVGVWPTYWTREQVLENRHNWHPNASLRLLTYTEHVEEIS